jgi:polyisoprenoid-binding protein YceI
MKTKNIFVLNILSIIMFGLIFTPALAGEIYRVDPDHTYLLFKVKHLKIVNSHGRFHGPTGKMVWNDVNPSKSSINISVSANNIDTDVEKRDRHLRSPDFFNVKKYSTITFESTHVKKLAPDIYEVTGGLTILGKTLPLVIKVRQTGFGQDPWGKFRRGFETQFTIKRSDWGMDFMLDKVSDEVIVNVSVEVIRV